MAEQYLAGKLYNWKDVMLPIGTLGIISLILAVNLVDKGPGVNGFEGWRPGFYPMVELRHFVFATVAIVMAMLWRKMRWIGFRALVRPFALFAPISYTMYILHDFIFVRGTHFHFIDNSVLRWISYFVMLIVISYIIERVIYPRVANYFRGSSIRIGSEAQKNLST